AVVTKREERHHCSDCNGDGSDGEERGEPGPAARLPKDGPLRKRSPGGLFEGEHLPRAGDALQGVDPPLLEVLARTDGQVANRAREDDVPRPGESGDPRADVHREAADLLAHALALARA